MSRYPRPDLPPEALASPGTTIVGGRPPEGHQAQVPVPTGIQRLLRHATAHPDFLARLLAGRAGAAAQAGVPLTANEARILASIPEEALLGMVRSLAGARPRPVARQASTAAALLLGGASLTAGEGCAGGAEPPPPPIEATERPYEPSPPPAGIQPDLPPPIPEIQEPLPPVDPQPTRGIRPDLPPPLEEPPPRVEEPLMPLAGGVAPDEPPPRPTQREMETEGGAAPDLPEAGE